MPLDYFRPASSVWKQLIAASPSLHLLTLSFRAAAAGPCRPGLQERARYYAVVYLNQMVLTHKPPAQQQKGGCHGGAA